MTQKRYTFRIPENLDSKLEEEADRRGQTKAAILRNAAWRELGEQV